MSRATSFLRLLLLTGETAQQRDTRRQEGEETPPIHCCFLLDARVERPAIIMLSLNPKP